MTSTTKYGNATSSNTRAIYGGGLAPNDTTYTNTIEFFTIATLGNGTDFGDLTVNRSTTPGATSNNIRGIFAGGYAPCNLNIQDHDNQWWGVDVEPGQMIMFESGCCMHGRLDEYKGTYFDNLYTHFTYEEPFEEYQKSIHI